MSDVGTASSGIPWLTVLVFLPLVGAILLYFIRESAIRWAALAVAVADFLWSLPLWFLFDPSSEQMQFVERVPWITSPSMFADQPVTICDRFSREPIVALVREFEGVRITAPDHPAHTPAGPGS